MKFILIIIFAFTACLNTTAQLLDTLATGATYSIGYGKIANAKKVEIGNYLKAHFTRKIKRPNQPDSLLFSSRIIKKPENINVDSALLKTPRSRDIGTTKVLGLQEGDSIMVYTDIKKIVASFPEAEKSLGREGTLINIIYILKVYNTLADYKKIEKVENTKNFTKYIEENKLAPYYKPRDSIYVKITEKGNGPTIKPSNFVKINYIAKKINGQIFNSNYAEINNQPRPPNTIKTFDFEASDPKLIKGFTTGLKYLSKGSKATLILPYHMAYGERGYQFVMPFEGIIFEIEVLDILQEKPLTDEEEKLLNYSNNLNEVKIKGIKLALSDIKGLKVSFIKNKAILSGKISAADNVKLSQLLAAEKILADRTNLKVE